MAWKKAAAAAATAILAVGCSAETAAPAQDANAAAAPAPVAAATASASANPIVQRYDRTMSGQPLTNPPAAPFQLLVTRAEFPASHRIACHRHTWPRYVYLQQGNLRVINYDAHRVDDFSAGDTLVEPIGQWHGARVGDDGPVKVVVYEQVPPGQSNTFPAPPPPVPSPCMGRG